MKVVGEDHNGIHPTGTCFEDVTMEFSRLCFEEKRHSDESFCMVHGICTTRDGRPYSHAWIEDGGFVWFGGLLWGRMGWFQTTLAEFDREFRVQERTRYTFSDLLALAQRIGNEPPPWEERYRRLCRDYKEGSCGS